MAVELPEGFLAGHHTDRDGWTGCTVLLGPEGTVASGEVRGGGPGTRESDLLSPATSTPGPQAILLTGGSAFGLGAADGVVRWLEERGRGHPTPAGLVPLVSAAVIYDLMLGDPKARPTADDAYTACASATASVEAGSVGAGTGASVGKLLGPDGRTKGGLGAAALTVGDANVVAVAAVNAIGDVLDADGSVLAGAWDGARYVRATDLLRSGSAPVAADRRESTTLVAVLTDARMSKLQAWLAARAASSGVARAVSPSATPFDGDMTFVMSSNRVDADPFIVAALVAEAAAEAIRSGVREATGAPGCPAVGER